MTASESTAAPRASVWEDFVDIFYAPSSVYERRRDSGFFLALVVLTITMAAITYAALPVLRPMMDAEFQRGMAAATRSNPQMTPEMMQKARAVGEKIQTFGILVFIPIGVLLTGLVLWVVGKLVGARENLQAACMVATYAFFPRILEQVLNLVQGFVLSPEAMNGRFRLSLGLARFMNPDTASPVLLAVIGRIDVFTIWVTVLLAIGLSVTGRIPRSRAAIAGVAIWVLGMLPGLIGALRQA